MAGLTYKDAGVDIAAGDRLVDRIKPLAASTRTSGVLSAVGGFAGLMEVPGDIPDPVLVSGTDGVGTKLKLAFQLDRHDSVGIDLVAMCVNDILTVGARPLFFLDYFATGALDVDRGEAVVRGIAEGCRQAGCTLLGGETAELPGFYDAGEYDLAGFAVGVVSRSAILEGRVEEGAAVIGVGSSGIHSNGLSLARKALFERGGHALHASIPELDAPLGETLLTPTRVYARAVRGLLESDVGLQALCHITGGGLPGNLPRILPEDLAIELDRDSWKRPPIFDVIQRAGAIEEEEMRRAFNLGLGLVAVVPEAGEASALAALKAAGETATRVGTVSKRHQDPVLFR